MDWYAFLKFVLAHYKIAEDELRACFEESKKTQTSFASMLTQKGFFTESTLENCVLDFSESLKKTIVLQNPAARREGSSIKIAEIITLLKDVSTLDTLEEAFEKNTVFLRTQPLLSDSVSLKDQFFGKYKVLEKIAQGGMGVVYRVQHKSLEQEYALKVISSLDSESKEIISRFHREAKMAAKLKHRGIVQVFDSGEENGLHYFCMEYIEGKTLEKLIEEGISIQKGIRLIQKILEALHYAHTQGVIHRDLKPSNIFITKSEEPKIGDFGLAKDMKHSSNFQKLTQSGDIMGTPAYMPPEQASGKAENLDSKADIYAMGACFYQMLTKQCPFEGKTIQELFFKIFSEEPLPPSKHNPKVHRDLDTIVLKALEKAKSRRYETAKAFSDDIKRFYRGYPILARPVSKRERLFKWMKRHRQTIFVGGVIMLLSLSFFASTQWKQYQTRQKALIAKEKKFRKQIELAEVEHKDSIEIENDRAKGKKIKHLLNALNYLNYALLIKPQHYPTEQKKLQIGSALITLACENGEYELADYIARDLKELNFLPEEKKEKFQEEIREAQNQKLKQHMARFKSLVKELKKPNQSWWLKESALLEISKMQEREIFDELVAILEKGTDYFLKKERGTVAQDKFYEMMALALGRLENPEAKVPLIKALVRLFEKVTQQSLQERSQADIQFMVALVQSLAFAKVPGLADYLANIRFQMGQNTNFWVETEEAYQALLKLEKTEKQQLDKEDVLPEIPIKEKEKEKPLHNEDYYQQQAFKKYTMGNLKGALKDFTTAIKIAPHNANIFTNRGIIKMAQRDLKGAIADHTRAIEIDPRLIKAYSNRGLVWIQLGENEKAIQDFDETVRLKPNFAYGYGNRGLAKLNINKVKEAIQDFDLAIRYNPKFAKAYTCRGLAKGLLKEYKKALQDCGYAIKLNPRYGLAHYHIGRIYFDQQKDEEAIRFFNKCLALDPKQKQAYFYRGQAKVRRNDFQGAFQDYNEALRLSPSSEMYRMRGRLLAQHKKYKRALSDYEQAIQLNPNFLEAYQERGKIRHLQKDFYGAIRDFSTIIKLNPFLDSAYEGRGLARIKISDWKNAIQDANKCLQIQANNLKAYEIRGVANFYLKKLEPSLEDFNKVLLAQPHNTLLYFLRGKTYLGLKNKEAAKKDFQQYLALNSGNNSLNESSHLQLIWSYFPELRK